MYTKTKLTNIGNAMKLPNSELKNLLDHPASKILTGEQAVKIRAQHDIIEEALTKIAEVADEIE